MVRGTQSCQMCCNSWAYCNDLVCIALQL